MRFGGRLSLLVDVLLGDGLGDVVLGDGLNDGLSGIQAFGDFGWEFVLLV